ncbi:hypothetical protein HPB50_016909 [Hyalomma asiaticum]|uniref:Uncharacterized protein n=1 Tax=Hyalomma asiaticum TaxID=266040 RepID=A0ACB7TJ27_HYAAI|nr:hypothetical protein HPB50_016909 [Hyalomma asiaticum]
MPSVSVEERAHIVSPYQHDVSQRQIAAIMNRQLCTVNRICQAFREEGRLCNLPRGHRQRVMDSAKDLLIKQAANDAPFITAREIKDSLNLSATTPTIRRRLHENGLRSHLIPGTYSTWQAAAAAPSEFGARCPRRALDHWFACEENSTQRQDRSPIHTAKLTTRVLEELGMMLLEWPPQGADMKIVENVWGAMKKALSRRPIAGGSQDALWAAVKEEWERLRASNFVDRLFNSLPRRMRAVVAAEGGFTKY